MDFSDTTVVIPAKEEPAVYDVTNDVLESLNNCRVIILYNGYGDSPPKFSSNRVEGYEAPVGKGRAIIMLQERRLVKTPIMCFIDGDATYEPNNLRKMVELVRDGTDMVLGNRLKSIDHTAMPKYIHVGNKVLTDLANVLYKMRLEDSQTGLRAIKTDAFYSIELTETEFGIETEMNVKMRKSGYKIEEILADYYERVGKSKQKKLVDGLKLLLIDFRFLFYKPKKDTGKI